MSKAGEHLYKSTAKIINDIKEDGLHNVLADGIDHFGDTITYFTTETYCPKILSAFLNPSKYLSSLS